MKTDGSDGNAWMHASGRVRPAALAVEGSGADGLFSIRDGTDLLEVTSGLYCARSLDALPGPLLSGLRSLIPFELGGCHVVHRGHQTITAFYRPESAFLPVRHKDFWRLAGTHPLNPLLFANPARAFMLSDAISLPAFLETELYHLLYRPLRVNRELAAVLPDESADGGHLLISLHRSGREFSERDRALLNLLLPHVTQARRRLLASESRRFSEGEIDFNSEPAFHEWIRRATEWRLTRRESDVLFWLSQGKTNSEIGRILGMAERTAETHALRLYPKIGVENRYNAIAMLSRLMAAGER